MKSKISLLSKFILEDNSVKDSLFSSTSNSVDSTQLADRINREIKQGALSYLNGYINVKAFNNSVSIDVSVDDRTFSCLTDYLKQFSIEEKVNSSINHVEGVILIK
jgi:hypothetical protein